MPLLSDDSSEDEFQSFEEDQDAGPEVQSSHRIVPILDTTAEVAHEESSSKELENAIELAEEGTEYHAEASDSDEAVAETMEDPEMEEDEADVEDGFDAALDEDTVAGLATEEQLVLVASDGEVKVDTTEIAADTKRVELLPPELLNLAPRAPAAIHTKFSESTEGLTRKERETLRNRSRQAKKRKLDWLRRNSEGTGVIETGLVAQARRSVNTGHSSGGRIEKRRPARAVGRQRVLRDRLRHYEDQNRQLSRPAQPRRRNGRRR